MEKLDIATTENIQPEQEQSLEDFIAQYPELGGLDELILSKSLKTFDAESEDGIVNESLDTASVMLGQKIYRDIQEKKGSRLTSPLCRYINERAINTSQIYYSLKALESPIDELAGTTRLDDVMGEAVVPLTQTLNQPSVWNNVDRSNRSIIFEMLSKFDLTDLADEQKSQMVSQLKSFVESIKYSRARQRNHCLEDIIRALQIIEKIDPKDELININGRVDIFTVGEKLLKEVGDNEWPVIDSSFTNPSYEKSDDVSNHYSSEYIIEKCQEAMKQTEIFGRVSQKITPALHLHFFNNILEEEANPNIQRDEALERRKLEAYIKDEKSAEENPYLPTIGVEIEVPKYFTIDENLFEATSLLGIPREGESFLDNEAWEFAIDFSYSAKTQSLIAHELIRGGFIETEEEHNKKKIRGAGDFSMHINLGFPLEIADKLKGVTYTTTLNRELQQLKDDSDVLVNALTYAYTSPQRIENRKTNKRFTIDRPAKKGKDKKGGKEEKEYIEEEDEDDSMVPSGRLEIRSLEVRDATLYRLLPEAQLLASALFTSHLDSTLDDKQIALKAIWQDFSVKVQEAFSTYFVSPEVIDKDEAKALFMLKETNIPQQMREYITETSQKIQKIIQI